MNIIRVLDNDDGKTLLEVIVSVNFLDEAISVLSMARQKWEDEDKPNDLRSYLHNALDSHNIPYSYPEIHAMYM